MITCNGEYVYLIKIHIQYVGSKIIGPTVIAAGSKNCFLGPKLRFFTNISKNSKRYKKTLNCKNVKLHMTYNITSISKFKVLSDIIETGKDLLFVQGTNRLLIIIIFFLLPPTFEKKSLRRFATCRNGLLRPILYSEGLFGHQAASRNFFPLRSYLPKGEKPCYRNNSETVIDTFFVADEM